MNKQTLKEYIKLVIAEARKLREADISDDKKVPWGSDDHVADLEKRVSNAEYWKNKHPRGSAKRSHYQTILTHLKNELKSARRTNQALNEKDED